VAARLRLLVIAPFAPRSNGRHGGARAIARTIAALSGRHDVGLAHVAADGDPGVDAAVGGSVAFVEPLPAPDVRGGRRWARRAIVDGALIAGIPIAASELRSRAAMERLAAVAEEWRPDVVQFEFLSTAILSSAAGTDTTPRVLVEHDATLRPVQPFDHLPRAVGSTLEALDARAWRRFAARTAHRFDAAVAFTERDVASCERAGFSRVERIPLAMPARDRPLDAAGAAPPSILFVGYYRHPPNADAARWLVREIFPRVRAECPSAQLVLVGDQLPADVRERAGRGVVAAGAVDDVSPYLDRAAVVVAPLRTGGGTRVKVVEALGAGKAVVATPLALEGVDVPREAALVANSTTEFAASITSLLRDDERRRQLGAAAYAWARSALDVDRAADQYHRLYIELLHRP
jgi:glycosyltransferase involved in cell wall biosynthesis